VVIGGWVGGGGDVGDGGGGGGGGGGGASAFHLSQGRRSARTIIYHVFVSHYTYGNQNVVGEHAKACPITDQRETSNDCAPCTFHLAIQRSSYRLYSVLKQRACHST
jgi:hypothetical protein